ncbi:MAG: hypothetical protein HC905_27310 [Bacteroidales bacterium]|nr:hypothetical protein [Bacteroidales bacterium]
MENEFDDKLKETVGRLPGYKANPDSWTFIEQYLSFSEKLNNVKQDLSVINAPDDIWKSLEDHCGRKSKYRLTLIMEGGCNNGFPCRELVFLSNFPQPKVDLFDRDCLRFHT